jgi:hypothetical protein
MTERLPALDQLRRETLPPRVLEQSAPIVGPTQAEAP